MTKKRRRRTQPDCEDLAARVAERVLEAQRERRRRFWSQLGYAVMLLGAASGLVTLLVMVLG